MIQVNASDHALRKALQAPEIQAEITGICDAIRDGTFDRETIDRSSRFLRSRAIQQQLLRIFHGKCAFCEAHYIPTQRSGYRHYRPISRYPWLLYDPHNLLNICAACNDHKRDQFPFFDLDDEPSSISIDLRALLASWESERPMLLHPRDDDPDEHLALSLDGSVRGLTPRGDLTIDVVGLNRQQLSRARQQVITDIFSAVQIAAEDTVSAVREAGRERLGALFRLPFRSIFENLQRRARDESEYSFVARSIMKSPEPFLDRYIADDNLRTIAMAAFDLFVADVPMTQVLSEQSFTDTLTRALRSDGRAVRATATVEEKTGGYLASCDIDGYFCLKDLHLDNLDASQEIYFLGENGDGKTLLLQAIVLALVWPRIESSASRQSTARVFDLIKANENLDLRATDSLDNHYLPGNPIHMGHVFAYGVHRGRRDQDKADKHGFMTLFSDDQYLRDPVAWLRYLYVRELENKPLIPLAHARQLLRTVLDAELELDVSADEVAFTERGSRLSIAQLSEGYRSVMTWVLDLLSRLAESQPDVTELRDYHGVVLIDEVSLHLHPRWEYDLVGRLRTWFPKIQFLFTTHSPTTILGASDDAVIFKLYRQDGITRVSERYHAGKDLAPLMANAILTSPLFQREHARMRAFHPDDQEIDTSDSYLHSRVHRAIAQEVADLREAGRAYLSPDDIDSMIQTAIARHRDDQD